MKISKKRWIGAGLALAAGAALLPAVVLGQATTSKFEARLTGANEVPAVTTTATGTFTATLDEAAGTLTWTLSVPTITNATAAHLHAGAAGANGGIVLPLFAAPTAGPVGTINVSGTARAADLSGTLAGNFAGFVTALKAGTIYANVHTTANAGGEIRAQVVAAAAAPAPTTTTAAPAPAKTGNGGPDAVKSESGSRNFAVISLIAVSLVAIGGARILTARKR
ncbi:MAG: CHRD domain-containing protein [Dehalococcoidia bacterium]|nr:MAG: CHRD domain-containing protein [Dehalococcoidia bacterium]